MEDSLGAYIQTRRKALGYDTQGSFAEAAGIARAHLSQIESGKIALPNASMRRKIADALQVRHVDLLIAAGEIAPDEVDGEPSAQSDAVARLALLIDSIDWGPNDDRLVMVESLLRGMMGLDKERSK